MPEYSHQSTNGACLIPADAVSAPSPVFCCSPSLKGLSVDRIENTNADSRSESASTLASSVYRRLRKGIISGEFAPGSKLNIRALCETFGSTLSPVREALNRLTPEGLVLQSDNRGFMVAPVSMAEMKELTLARCWMNEAALRDAIAHGDALWEENVLLALHRLSRSKPGDPETPGHKSWADLHSTFHATLICGCRSRHLLHYCGETYIAAERYRLLARRSAKRWLAKVDHEEIATAAINRKADLAADLLNRHFQRTAELVEAILAETGT
jgi:GntR family carbon starvation induced transcriptional regulator